MLKCIAKGGSKRSLPQLPGQIESQESQADETQKLQHYLRLAAHLRLRCPGAVIVNVDETPVARAQARRLGWVARCASRRRAYERLGRKHTHSHLTLIATVRSHPDLQARMPQMLLAGKGFTLSERRLLGQLPRPIRLLPWRTGTLATSRSL